MKHNPLLHLICVVLGATYIAFGFSVFLGGVSHFTMPNYEYILRLSFGEIWPYGMLWFASGVFMIINRDISRQIGLFMGLFISHLWAALFFVSAAYNVGASYNAVVATAGYGFLNAAILVFMYSERKNINESDA